MASTAEDREPALRLVHDSEPPGTWTIEQPIVAAIEAVRRITGAVSADVVVLNQRTGAITIAAMPSAAARAVPRCVRDAIDAQHRGLIDDLHAIGCLRWLAGPCDDHAMLLARIADQPSRIFFVVLIVADQAAARERASVHIPEIATLVRLYATTGTYLDVLRERRDAAMQALDQSECGVIAVRGDQSIVLANAAAQRLLTQETGLHVRRGMVRPTNYADAVRFREALSRTIDPPRNETEGRRRAIAMLLTPEAGARPLLVVIAPAEGARELAGVAATISVFPPETGMTRGIDTLCKLHGLSKVESRLVGHLMTGQTLTEAADEMRVRTETARAYLKQIFGKTGAHRQADRMAMMARYARAFRGDFDFLPG